MLEVINLTKKYKQKAVVNNVNLYLEDGEIVGLLGPNGAGKSTLISMITSLIVPTSGDVQLNGKSTLKNPAGLREILGVVPQEIALYLDLSAEENLMFFGRIHNLKGAKLKSRVDEVLAIIGLEDRRKDLVKNFSGGMQRRLNIGVALLHHPRIIIMDEPTVGIDPQSRNYILETVKTLNREQGMTVLYTSHYMEEVEFLCDRLYIQDHGDIIASGTIEEIKQILSSENAMEIKIDKPSGELEKALLAMEGITSVKVQDTTLNIIASRNINLFKAVLPAAEELGVMLTSVEVKNPTLEDVFLHLTGRVLRN